MAIYTECSASKSDNCGLNPDQAGGCGFELLASILAQIGNRPTLGWRFDVDAIEVFHVKSLLTIEPGCFTTTVKSSYTVELCLINATR